MSWLDTFRRGLQLYGHFSHPQIFDLTLIPTLLTATDSRRVSRQGVRNAPDALSRKGSFSFIGIDVAISKIGTPYPVDTSSPTANVNPSERLLRAFSSAHPQRDLPRSQ